MIEVTRPDDKFCSCQSCGTMSNLLKIAVFKSTASINVTYLCKSCLTGLGKAAKYFKDVSSDKAYQYVRLSTDDNDS